MSWIWLNGKTYPQFQENFSNINAVCDSVKEKYSFCTADFTKKYIYGVKIRKAVLTVSADCFFHLFVNGEFTGIGPVSSGGDFLCRHPAPKHYSNTYTVDVNSGTLDIFAKVRLLPQVLTDYSRNHGGFMLDGVLVLENGEEIRISTDGSWDCRPDTAYDGFCSFNSENRECPFEKAEELPDRWHAEPAPIPMLDFSTVYEKTFTLKCGEKAEYTADLDRIWGAYPVISSTGRCIASLETGELEGQVYGSEKAVFSKAGEYFSFRMHSIGRAVMTVENNGSKDIEVTLKLIESHYPVEKQGKFVCSDADFNKVMDVCGHTLKICRQTLHLDSTKHQEHLACTGDYYIESLITLYMFGDMRLSEFDVIRTADWITANNGRMFHTTYSLIWVQMLHDVYMITGSTRLLENCEKALDALLARFENYIGDYGVIEYPPDFMFVDWTVIDGYSMHHPPKALGQTVLNAFYYQALIKASEIYSYLGHDEKASDCTAKAKQFREDFNREFFDSEKKLYFDGKNDAYGGFAHYIPDNSRKRYYSKYPNILASLYGLADDGLSRDILKRIIFNGEMQDIQPYFMHYMICAVRRCGLFPEYGMKLLSRWKDVVNECDKGLKEGWIAPQPDYSFDHSHAWGGTVAYQLPSVITGMKIVEPGMKKLSFAPDLCGLDFADITIPTEYGDIVIKLDKNKAPVITVPDGIELI